MAIKITLPQLFAFVILVIGLTVFFSTFEVQITKIKSSSDGGITNQQQQHPVSEHNTQHQVEDPNDVDIAQIVAANHPSQIHQQPASFGQTGQQAELDQENKAEQEQELELKIEQQQFQQEQEFQKEQNEVAADPIELEEDVEWTARFNHLVVDFPDSAQMCAQFSILIFSPDFDAGTWLSLKAKLSCTSGAVHFTPFYPAYNQEL